MVSSSHGSADAVGPLGVLLLDTCFPRGRGDIGNAASYDVPVLLKTVPGATVDRVVKQGDPALLVPFMTAAKELEAQGACAITTSCGFLAPFQAEVAKALSIPVFLSSLLQIHLAYMMTQRRVGLVTANSERLTPRHLRAAGVPEDLPLAVKGLQTNAAFHDWIFVESGAIDIDAVQQAILEAAETLLNEHPDIGAFVFECHNLAPYAPVVARTTQRPVFDIIAFAHWVYDTMAKREFLATST